MKTLPKVGLSRAPIIFKSVVFSGTRLTSDCSKISFINCDIHTTQCVHRNGIRVVYFGQVSVSTSIPRMRTPEVLTGD
jgi:hypothetical protein